MTNALKWDLSPLYSGFDDENYKNDINNVIKMLDDFDAWSKALASATEKSEEIVHHYLEQMQKISLTLENCNLFAELSFTVNTGDTVARTYMEQMEQLGGKMAPINRIQG